MLPPPPDPVALSPQREKAVGNLRTRAAVVSDHAAAVQPLQAQLSVLENDAAAEGATPAQQYALKKKIALLKANIRREQRISAAALESYES